MGIDDCMRNPFTARTTTGIPQKLETQAAPLTASNISQLMSLVERFL
jgi:hypothetical protein